MTAAATLNVAVPDALEVAVATGLHDAAVLAYRMSGIPATAVVVPPG